MVDVCQRRCNRSVVNSQPRRCFHLEANTLLQTIGKKKGSNFLLAKESYGHTAPLTSRELFTGSNPADLGTGSHQRCDIGSNFFPLVSQGHQITGQPKSTGSCFNVGFYPAVSVYVGFGEWALGSRFVSDIV